ncbi:MAG: hypothetical protein JXA20_12350 [Spirochaetes bacterium]|nr:hypothetical protein [Spirochaetota bacterium]
MKRLITVGVTCIVSILLMALPAGALTLSAGPVAWYAWWNPAFKDGLTTMRVNMFGIPFVYPSYNTKFTMEPAPLYGPMLSISQGNWTVSSVFTTGRYHAKAQGVFMTMGIPPVMVFRTDNNIRKHDLDTAVNYSLTDFMKLYFGFKYQRYGFTFRYQGPGLVSNQELTFNGYSSGIGLAFTVPVTGNFYLLSTVSGIYMIIDVQHDTMTYFSPPYNQYVPSQGRGLVHCLGGNILLSMAYHIEPIATTLSAGIRYQYIHFFEASESEVKNITRSGRDQFYGIFVSAVYSLDL